MAVTVPHTSRQETADPPRTVIHVVPHAHWDLEWYQTYESFQAQLGHVMSDVLDAADRDIRFTFMPDGQVAMVDAHLEAHPEDAERVRAAVERGAVVLGPWYTLSDQFLVSGETTIRNLEMGRRRARELGGQPMMIGYCPDQFGQIAQMPQILAMFGIRHAVALRGVPPAITSNRFDWIGLDGTVAETLHLGGGYCQLELLEDARGFAAWLTRGRAATEGRALLLSGDDHRTSVSIPAHVADAGGIFSTLQRYWESLPPLDDGAPAVRGELRSAGQEGLLSNVVSNRVDLRLATAAAERDLERYAEPLAAFCLARYPTERLETAWRRLVRNAAHDSICATSADEVTDAVMVRARSARDIARGVVDDSLQQLGTHLEHAGMYTWNPSPWPRDVRTATNGGQVLHAESVPGLGWAPLSVGPDIASAARFAVPPMRVLGQVDRGDTYNEDCDGEVHEVSAEVPVTHGWSAAEPFARLHIEWLNRRENHRVRLHIRMPRPALECVADTPFGAVYRPSEPSLRWGRDRFSGYPAGRFIVAGGIAVLVDRVCEFEILPETQEIAITLLRAVGAVSRERLRTRPYAAAPVIASRRAQMQGDVCWNLAVLPWDDAERLPWREWEQFALPMPVFTAPGGGELPRRGTAWEHIPAGNLSAVFRDAIRVFDPGPPWRIRTVAARPLR